MSMHIARQEPYLGGATYFDLKLTYEVGPAQLKEMLEKQTPLQIVDVRSPDAYAEGHIAQAVSLPFDRRQGVQYLYHLNKTTPVVIVSYGPYCTLASEAAFLLAKNGYRVRTLIGGMEGWLHYSLPVQQTETQPPTHAGIFENFAHGEETDDVFW